MTVTGNDSNTSGKIEFETISGNGAVDLKKESISVCEPYKSYMVLQRRTENKNFLGFVSFQKHA